MKRRLLIVGGGGREHALAWKLNQSPEVGVIYVAPGNGGTEQMGGIVHNVPIATTNLPDLLRFAQEKEVNLTIVGPENPLAAGIVDQFTAAGLACFGPSQAATQIEASKAFAKQFMREWSIPTADFAIFDDYQAAHTYLKGRSEGPVVVKASGLAAGKGVFVCQTRAEAQQALAQIMEKRIFGASGSQVVIEEMLRGEEISVLAFSDGKTLRVMPPAQDHKPVYDGDRGPNTGGMGCYAPVPQADDALLKTIKDTILQPAIAGMAARGTPYVGVLYAGLILTHDGPKVLEFNCRLGDPETEVLLPLLETDFLPIADACLAGQLDRLDIHWRTGSCATVIMASGRYPGTYRKGLPISGVQEAEALPGVIVFHAGTRPENGKLLTNGGRVLAVTAVGSDLPRALARAYDGVERIHFEGMHYRRDIGRQGLQHLGMTYQQAGVDLDAGSQTIALIRPSVESTYTPAVLAGIGAFGGLFAADALQRMQAPVLVASTDGVGTKTEVAVRIGRFAGLGRDIVHHCINDILCHGARPLFFLDYMASGHLRPEVAAEVVEGIAAACRAHDCVLLGGETAEMPDVYRGNAVDLVGTVIGVVERERIIDGSRIQPGDQLLALPANGLHTNGYTLARRILADWDWNVIPEGANEPLSEMLLRSHPSYFRPVNHWFREDIDVKGLAHITGGGLTGNLSRILPAGLRAEIQRGTWPVPFIFELLRREGHVPDEEMWRVFNMGIGMVAVIPPEQVQKALALLQGGAFHIGEISAGRDGGVRFVSM